MPNYDLPNPAPEPLRQVQLFVNSTDREHRSEWMPGWLEEHGLAASDFDRAIRLREAFRALLHCNNVGGEIPEGVAVVNEAARAVVAQLEGGEVKLVGTDALGEVTAIALTSMLDGTWRRLKVCRKCEWAFYDASKNRSGSWCSMQLCGNRQKTRAYRARKRSTA
ncbi:MAG TPA: CGNR zinc finger domain-containing protein [Gaiellaceae bacterium]|jgi:predicted RNA-binding Zn ribbon-like protein